MTLMTTEQIQEGVADFTRDEINNKGESLTSHCGDSRAAYAAVDQWFEDNQASLIASLPEPFKSATTGSQKTRFIKHVIDRKYRG